jgi:hypothetical protein
MKTPHERHWKEAKMILIYIHGRIQFMIHYNSEGTPLLVGFTDSDWAGDPDDQKTTAGYVFNCNVPTLGHHHSVEVYDDQSIQMELIENTGVIESHCGVQLSLLIIFHHYGPFCIGWLWFRCIPTISMLLTILSYELIEFTEEVILGTLLGGTSQCNSSLESG